jgi:hypothetical protein
MDGENYHRVEIFLRRAFLLNHRICSSLSFLALYAPFPLSSGLVNLNPLSSRLTPPRPHAFRGGRQADSSLQIHHSLFDIRFWDKPIPQLNTYRLSQADVG